MTKQLCGLGEHLGDLLRSAFVEPSSAPVPAVFLDLLQQLDARGGAHLGATRQGLSNAAFKHELSLVVPQLRAYARALSRSADWADDLVQEAMLNAWAARHRFQAGTSMKSWTFTILRNVFISQMRRSRHAGGWDPITADRLLAQPASQDKSIELSDVQRALAQLHPGQRQALLLVGAGGFSYEEAAEISGCGIGTIRSRIARGRAALEQIISDGKLPTSRQSQQATPGSAFDGLMAQVDELAGV